MARKGSKQWRENIGRNVSKLTEENVKKLEEAFSIDATIEEACFYAGISHQTYYDWIERQPKLLDRFDALRQKLPLASRRNIAEAISEHKNLESSWKYLQAKRPLEFTPKQQIEHSGEITGGEPHPEDEALRLKLKEGIKENIKKRWKDKVKKENEQRTNT